MILTTKKRVASDLPPKSKSPILALSSNDWIFTQNTICASVCCEPNSHLITPDTSKFVNSWNDCWSNESMKANYGSFQGAFNFVNHEDEIEKSVGFIPDVALRKIIINAERNIYVYYVDILVATHRLHKELCDKIISQKIEYLSMGCMAQVWTCSKCGRVCKEEYEHCDCLDFKLGKKFIDDWGNRRLVASLLGNSNPGSCEFIEASWLTTPPAYGGAVKRHVLPIEPDTDVFVEFPEDKLTKPAVAKYLSLTDMGRLL